MLHKPSPPARTQFSLGRQALVVRLRFPFLLVFLLKRSEPSKLMSIKPNIAKNEWEIIFQYQPENTLI